ncbi:MULTISPECIES: helix-turn-helix domain-containing protein [Acidithiobacillus]|uniref:ER transcriptional regulator n=1 Tax=Acidithiobacillus thiooxidans ATCC 19377 TaxID=637390 RepID=A0A5P9XPX5_ACITH|nr:MULTISPECIES: helix-turn-helix transcriptional regulator [Acidithiobacillus]MDD5278038.1 helix-turn-helix transcriptional regulator [Acidithiobacillus sp.]QFX96055.1 eR transcriptional regulator [Acidithiobacillus thiooxidans ATCC 19377]
MTHVFYLPPEVLRWTGDGKTSGEIANILQISERTVNFHTSKAITKLQVNNKTAAVLQASMLGLL